VRFEQARTDGLVEELVDEIRDGYQSSTRLSERQKAVLRFTDAFLRDPGGEHAALRDELRKHFSAQEIVELAAGVALFMGFSKIAVALGQAPQNMPVTVLPTPDH
jgi:alkylhydroperoxidase family enzyme